jgi:hypothetical protein
MARRMMNTIPLEGTPTDNIRHYINWCNTPLLPDEAAMLRGNPAVYWKHYAKMHPEQQGLCDFALTLLAISATEMDCEREFSRIAWMVGDYRVGMHDDRIVALSQLNNEKGRK